MVIFEIKDIGIEKCKKYMYVKRFIKAKFLFIRVMYNLNNVLCFFKGNYYLKLGYSEDFRKHYFTRPSEITNWYRSADTEMAELLASDAKHFIPGIVRLERKWMKVCLSLLIIGLNVSQYEVDHCAITLTPTELPYIGEAYPGVFVAVGCHGYAAKSSDEIGRLLAVLASEGRWDCSEFSADMFQCRYLNSKSTL